MPRTQWPSERSDRWLARAESRAQEARQRGLREGNADLLKGIVLQLASDWNVTPMSA